MTMKAQVETKLEIYVCTKYDQIEIATLVKVVDTSY